MELKLKSNPNLHVYDSANSITNGLSSTVSDNFKGKATGILITDCPNIDALSIFDAVSGYQTAAGRTKKLTNIRIQLGTNENEDGTYYYCTTGNYSKLCSYSKFGGTALSGYNDEGDAVNKPALVGTWRLTDYIDYTMADAVTGSANGMYFLGCPSLSAEYMIDWNDIAVQSLDSTKRNYNPALSVILHSKGYGTVHENTDMFDGKWWATNAEVSGIKDIGTWFKSVTGVDDSYGIVDSTSGGYKLTKLDELSGFTGVKTLSPSAFYGNADLKSARLPSNLRSVAAFAFRDCGSLSSIGTMPESLSSVQASAFENCSKLSDATLGSGILEIDEGAFSGCTSAEFSTLPSNLRYISNSSFKGCQKVTVSEIPSSVSFIGMDAFNGCTGITSLKLNRGKTKTNILSGAFDGTTGDICIGDLDSSWLDERLKRQYASDENWSVYASRIKSAYREYYEDKIPSGYEIQDFICSDGISSMTPTDVKVDNNTEFVTDVSFCGTPANSADSIHGTYSEGLRGIYGTGLVGRVGGDMFTIRTSSDYADGEVHNFSIDQKNFTIGMDWMNVYTSEHKTELTERHQISFFGDDTRKFVGASWMNRVVVNGVVEHEYVPVKKTDGGKLGFYDVVAGTFIEGGDYYTSEETQLGTVDGSGNTIVTEDGDTIVF